MVTSSHASSSRKCKFKFNEYQGYMIALELVFYMLLRIRGAARKEIPTVGIPHLVLPNRCIVSLYHPI